MIFKRNSIPNSKLVVSSFSLANSQRQIPTSGPHKKLSNARVMPVGDVDIYLKVHTWLWDPLKWKSLKDLKENDGLALLKNTKQLNKWVFY